jgi:lipopolysaccharide/colanic/teichoic acid biosynthesis glycosyltransferase
MLKTFYYQRFGKRLFDILVAISVLILISPLLLLLGFCSILFLGWPVLFKQVRIGYLENPFVLYKLRSMTEIYDRFGRRLPDEARLVPYGWFLRATSLDEFPTLWNVLRGEMSLVGPRPLLPEYLPRYTSHQARRHDVKPGITGWAQVNGRNAITWEEKFDLDVWYIDHKSFSLDMKILWLTLFKVLERKDISQQGHATMPEFMGNTTQSKQNE